MGFQIGLQTNSDLTKEVYPITTAYAVAQIESP